MTGALIGSQGPLAIPLGTEEMAFFLMSTTKIGGNALERLQVEPRRIRVPEIALADGGHVERVLVVRLRLEMRQDRLERGAEPALIHVSLGYPHQIVGRVSRLGHVVRLRSWKR